MPAYRNQRLFSDHYLQEILPQSDEWKYMDKEKLNEAFARIQSLYQKKSKMIPSLKESQLEEEFIRPILRILGHIYAPHPSISKVWEGAREPDYAFYPSEEAKKGGSIRKAIAIGEVKRYGRALGKKLKDEALFEVQNPSLQMSRYLWLSEVRWGILTDGRFWRLYERETSKRIDIFYEIDLEILLKKGNGENFKYFYLFFCKEAFPEFLQRVYDESLDYAEKVGEELKENVYQALKILAEGFLKTPENNLTPENLKKIHDNSLVLLYRLLFTLYAEYRRLLPLEENELYTDSYSLDSIKKEIQGKIDHNSPLSRVHTHYWDRLKELFGTINSGDPEMGVPFYNGGLFEPQKHPFLEEYKVADSYIAKVIDLLCRSKDKAFIDYSSLEARHLGSIYEGLLEYKVKIAEEALVATKKKGKEVFVPLREAKASGSKIRESEIIESGELYVATDKGERKASGSYYTPEYIVKYIVENTLGPVVEEKKKLIDAKIQELQKKFKNARGYNREAFENQLKQSGSGLIDEILKTKVLDPAMGSGHFLVEATDFLAHALVEALNREVVFETSRGEWFIRDKTTSYGENTDEDDIRWARREVVERCIYGVDLNPLAVELAKLSLWLYTVAKGKPLNFLDHHLKCGNSLIGAGVDDLANLPELRKKKKEKQIPTTQGVLFDISPMTVDLGLAVGNYFLIEDKLSNTLEDIKNKEKIYQNINRKWIGKWQAVGDLWISSYFGVKLDPALYKALSDYLLGKSKRIPEEWVKDFVDKASRIAKEKRFFHWELEFPEVFFDRQGRKLENPGFNVVMGNPPYIRFHNLNIDEIAYFLNNFNYATGQFDAFILMLEKGHERIRENGRFGFILPDLFLRGLQYEKLREMFLRRVKISNVVELGDKVFPTVQMPTCLFLYVKKRPNNNRVGFQTGLKDQRDRKSLLQKSFFYIPGKPLDIRAGFLLPKVFRASVGLGKIVTISRGLEIGKDKLRKLRRYWNDVPVLSGEEIQKYAPESVVFIDTNIAKKFSKEAAIFAAPKIMIRETGGVLLGCFDEQGILTLRTLHNVHIKQSEVNEKYILALINAKLLQYVFELCFKQAGNIFPKIRIAQERQLPIRRISFITPGEERQRLLEKFKRMYKKCLEELTPYLRNQDRGRR